MINDTYIVDSGPRSKIFCSFRNSPIVLLTLFNMFLRCSWKFILVSKIIPRCFWERICLTVLLLKEMEGWYVFSIFWEKVTSWTWLLGSGLFFSNHQIARRGINILFYGKRDVSFAKSLAVVDRSSDRSFM